MAKQGELLPGDLIFIRRPTTYANMKTCPPAKREIFPIPPGTLDIVIVPEEELKFEGTSKGWWCTLVLWAIGRVGYVELYEADKA
jgi:hypothetical protein